MQYDNITSALSNFMPSIFWTILVMKVLLQLVFASAVARDAGRLVKEGRTTWLVSGITWAFATLLGGVFIAAIYWFIHYSNLIRRRKD